MTVLIVDELDIQHPASGRLMQHIRFPQREARLVVIGIANTLVAATLSRNQRLDAGGGVSGDLPVLLLEQRKSAASRLESVADPRRARAARRGLRPQSSSSSRTPPVARSRTHRAGAAEVREGRASATRKKSSTVTSHPTRERTAGRRCRKSAPTRGQELASKKGAWRTCVRCRRRAKCLRART